MTQEAQLDLGRRRRENVLLRAQATLGRPDVEASDVGVAATRKAIVFGRVSAPSSDRALVRERLARVRWPGFEAIRLHHVYRGLAPVQGGPEGR